MILPPWFVISVSKVFLILLRSSFVESGEINKVVSKLFIKLLGFSQNYSISIEVAVVNI